MEVCYPDFPSRDYTLSVVQLAVFKHSLMVIGCSIHANAVYLRQFSANSWAQWEYYRWAIFVQCKTPLAQSVHQSLLRWLCISQNSTVVGNFCFPTFLLSLFLQIWCQHHTLDFLCYFYTTFPFSFDSTVPNLFLMSILVSAS